MKITFQFDNGTSRIYLTPENARDEQYLSLCVGGKTDVKVGPSKDKQLMLEFYPQAKQLNSVSGLTNCYTCGEAIKNVYAYGTEGYCIGCYEKLTKINNR